MNSDKWMLEQIKKRNEAGLKLLINQYTGLLKSIINKTLYYLPHHQEECLNDVLLAILNNIEQYDETKSSFKNWICVIAKYRSINFLKKYQKDLHTIQWEEDKHEEAYAHYDVPFKKELWEIELAELLAPLNERDQDLFKEYFYSIDSTDEIAARNDLSSGALYSRISRGKRKIRNFFADRGGEAHDG